MERNQSLKLSGAELRTLFDDNWSRLFPPILSVDQAARLAHTSAATIYDWSSRGLLRDCASKRGKRLRILRDRFIQFLFSEDNAT
jgi:hypothetical protein